MLWTAHLTLAVVIPRAGNTYGPSCAGRRGILRYLVDPRADVRGARFTRRAEQQIIDATVTK